MSHELVGENLYKWDCDWKGCTETTTRGGREGDFTTATTPVKPHYWQVITLTTTGGVFDSRGVLCPRHGQEVGHNIFDWHAPLSKEAS
jgi:hypothetical protein